MKKIILLKGLPASGKSTRAKQMVKDNPGQYKRINKDNLREMLDESRRSKINEKFVLDTRDYLVVQALEKGFNVIVDDTNFSPIHEKRLRELAKEYKAEFEVKEFNTPLWECIERDSKRENPVGHQVILDMYNKYIHKPLKQDDTLTKCIIVDIDGTLAQKGDRDIYDDTKLHLDTIIEPVKELVNKEEDLVFVMSGRSEDCRESTEKRLKDNGVLYCRTFFRKSGDKRDDAIVKKELYEENIKGKFFVKYIVDDRKKVKRMRVQEGLFVFDVNQFDLEF